MLLGSCSSNTGWTLRARDEERGTISYCSHADILLCNRLASFYCAYSTTFQGLVWRVLLWSVSGHEMWTHIFFSPSKSLAVTKGSQLVFNIWWFLKSILDSSLSLNIFALVLWKFHTTYFDRIHSLLPVPPRSSIHTQGPFSTLFSIEEQNRTKPTVPSCPACVVWLLWDNGDWLGSLVDSLCVRSIRKMALPAALRC